MAKRINGPLPDARNASKYSQLYPKIFDGNHWQLTRGVDFDEDFERVRATIYEAAKRKGFDLETRNVNGNLHLQATPKRGKARR